MTSRLLSRLRQPKTNVRWRLTLLYASLFLACGAALLAVTYALVAHATLTSGPARQVSIRPSSASGTAISSIRPRSEARPADATPPPAVQRLLKTPGGRATVRFVGTQQRIADLHELEIESGIALAIMVVISGGLGWVVAGRVLRPLEESLAAQRRFVAKASHELRTPLTAVRALLEMAITDPRPSVSSFREACRGALEESEQQEQLIDALLALAQGQSDVGRRDPVDLADIANEVLRAQRDEAEIAAVQIVASLSPAMVWGDRRLLTRLVSNLVENAIRHNVPHGRIDVRVHDADGRAVLSVANTGAVIMPGEIERLLQPFQRLAPARAGHRDGVGLGLSIVAAIARAHHAVLDIRPRDHGGLEIEVRFAVPGVAAAARPAALVSQNR